MGRPDHLRRAALEDTLAAADALRRNLALDFDSPVTIAMHPRVYDLIADEDYLRETGARNIAVHRGWTL